MQFNSLIFVFLFLPLLLCIYYMSKSVTYRNFVLTVFSLIFISWGDPTHIIFYLILFYVTYLGSVLLFKNKSKWYLTGFIVVITGVLVYFKYTNFSIGIYNDLLGQSYELKKIVQPLGISFVIFQSISLLVDVYQGKITNQPKVLSVLFYLSYFPKFISGPITRYGTLMDSYDSRESSLTLFSAGLDRFIIGLGKKVIISNQMALLADTIYKTSATDAGTLFAWIAALAYTFQIYFDFSGYTDMAIGISRMFGIDLPENFNFPYVAKSITDFWRRWHISLSLWFRDYIYIPLGGNRVKLPRQIFNLLVVWMLTGLWHGASYNFILWGLYYGILLIIEKYLLGSFVKRIPHFLQWLLTFAIVMIGWVIFRLTDLSQLISYFNVMFVYHPVSLLKLLESGDLVLVNLVYFVPAILFAFPWWKELNIPDTTFVYFVRHLSLIIVFFIAIVFTISSSYNPFIYFGF